MYLSLMKKIFLLLLFSTAVVINAQTNNEQTISLTGEAHKMVTPDIAVITFNITGRDKEENVAASKLNASIQQITDKIINAGFKKEDIKISGFGVNEDWDYSSAKARKIGYMASQSLIIKCKITKERLSSLFEKFSNEKTENVNVNFGTEVSDELCEKITAELIVLAVQDAAKKATLIATASKLKIKSSKNISYHTPLPDIYPGGVMNMKFSAAREPNADSAFSNFAVDDIRMSESIQITYLAENAQ